MEFSKVDPKDFKKKDYRKTKWQTLITDFVLSEDVIWKCSFEPSEYVSVVSAQTCVCQAIKRLRLNDSIGTRIIDGELYMVKKQEVV